MLSPDHSFLNMERIEPVQTIENKVIVGSEERQMKHVWIQNNEGNRADLDLFLKKLNIGCRACYETYYCVVCCYTEEDSRIAWILLRIRSNGPHRLNASDGDREEICHLDEEIADGDGEDIGARDGDGEEICHLHIYFRSALSRQVIRSGGSTSIFSLSFVTVLLGMIVQFVWSNASGALNRSQSGVSRLVLPKDFFAEVGVTIGTEVNRGLMFLQDLACRGSSKQFLMVAAIGLWLAAMIPYRLQLPNRFVYWGDAFCMCEGFVGAHTMPVLYEKYEDEVDGFVDSLLMKFHSHYKKMDTGFLS
ncbi:unnamed protein product [Brassica oleracea var. botrytis]